MDYRAKDKRIQELETTAEYLREKVKKSTILADTLQVKNYQLEDKIAELEKENGFNLPWNHPDFKGWTIIGMNHYHINGKRHLFVAIAKGGSYLKEEGEDDYLVWASLLRMVRQLAEGII